MAVGARWRVVQYRIDGAQEASPRWNQEIPYNYCHSAIRRQQFARLCLVCAPDLFTSVHRVGNEAALLRPEYPTQSRGSAVLSEQQLSRKLSRWDRETPVIKVLPSRADISRLRWTQITKYSPEEACQGRRVWSRGESQLQPLSPPCRHCSHDFGSGRLQPHSEERSHMTSR
jgi:hypothetical protein